MRFPIYNYTLQAGFKTLLGSFLKTTLLLVNPCHYVLRGIVAPGTVAVTSDVFWVRPARARAAL